MNSCYWKYFKISSFSSLIADSFLNWTRWKEKKKREDAKVRRKNNKVENKKRKNNKVENEKRKNNKVENMKRKNNKVENKKRKNNKIEFTFNEGSEP